MNHTGIRFSLLRVVFLVGVIAAGAGLASLPAASAVDASRTGQAQIDPGWEIAFVSERDGNREIYVMSADGSAVRRLTDHPAADVYPAWSYIGRGEYDPAVGLAGAEIFVVEPGAAGAMRVTNLTGRYGAARLSGEQTIHALSWSPDGRYLAFWVMEIIGPDMAANIGHAVIHVLDTMSGKITAYCGFATNRASPRLPALVWSPDGRYIAFGVDVPEDDRAALLLILDTLSGDYTEVSEGMYAAYGTYDPVMWGVR